MLYENFKGNIHIIKVTELSLVEFNPEIIMNSGQVFRFYKEGEKYTVISDNKMLKFEYLGNSEWLFYTTKSDFKNIWIPYFDLNSNYNDYNKVDSSDSFLVNAVKFSRGMRILKQDLWETMITFIISQQNNIPKIRKTVEILCKKFGTKKVYKMYSIEKPKEFTRVSFWAFPTPSQIACLSLSELCNDTLLGYRGKYILKLAQEVSSHMIDLNLLEKKLSPEQKFKYLLNIQGVGPKVANCIMLYGTHCMKSYPIDTWIEKVISEEYSHMNLEDYIDYINSTYEGHQGYIQQIQFYYKRFKNNFEKPIK